MRITSEKYEINNERITRVPEEQEDKFDEESLVE